MIDRREILAMAATVSLRPDVIEKDYVLGWLLAGIYNHPAINKNWVFKGGTCLKKCYFETYRFSEDLDFTLTDESQIDKDFLRGTFETIAEWVYEQTGIEVPKDGLSFDIYTNPRGKISCQGKVSYRGPVSPTSGGYPKIKLDLTADEKLVLSPALQPVYHPYSDEPEGGIQALCYVYEEVFGEKFRALAERTRPRDLYDVVNLFRNSTIKPAAGVLLDILRQKCEFKGISVPVLADLESHKESLEGSWANMLGHQLPNLPPVESYWNELPAIFEWIEHGHEPVIPTAYPLKPGETIIRERPGRSLTVRHGAQHLEIIRFAAANRLCVELDYVDDKGRHSSPIIEPYSLRSTQNGDVILHGIKVENGEHRSYRTDRIRGARVTNRAFTPRYEVELTSGGPVVLAPTVAESRKIKPFGTSIRRATRPVRRAGSSSFGPKYVFQCPMCQKKFTRSKNDSKLNKHKDKNGYPCSGRTGYLTEVK
jgi:predicted nucleotidyltransferase component of viral defense system